MIQGILYEKGSSAYQEAVLLFSEDEFSIEVNDNIIYKNHIDTLRISPRIGNIDRKITLKNACVFSTKNNDEIDQFLIISKKNKNILHQLETNTIWIVCSLILTILFTFSFVKWGIPSISKKIAYSIPLSVNNVISTNTLKILDSLIFKESQLSSIEKEKIQFSFEHDVLPSIDKSEKLKYKIHFRLWEDGKDGIANAFALPNGDIILTDKFVQLSQDKNEINAILLHEIAHVEQRHGLQRLIESSFIAVIVMFISGDISTLGDMGIGLGSLLITSDYSRNHESEADLFAFKKMLALKIDPINFSNIMRKITKNTSFETETNTGNAKDEKSIADFLSSHPNTSLRIKIADEYSECFKQGLLICPNN